MAIDKLVEGIQAIFNKRDSKGLELAESKESILKDIDKLVEEREGLSYKALIEEDKEAIKKFESIKKELETKEAELEATNEKIRALDKLEIGADTKEKAADIYKGIQKEIDSKAKELGKKADSYIKAKNDIKKLAIDIQDLHKEIRLLPLGLEGILEVLEPESIGKSQEDIEEFKYILSRNDLDRYLYLFDNTTFKHSKTIRTIKTSSIAFASFGEE